MTLAHHRLSSLFSVLGAVILYLLFLMFPAQTSLGARDGITLCLRSVFPALFPLFVASDLLISTGTLQLLSDGLSPVMKKLFRLPGCASAVPILGFCGGSVAGVRALISLRKNGLLSPSQCKRLLAFCGGVSPAFLVSFCGEMLFHGENLLWILILSHFLGSLLTAFLFLPFGGTEPELSSFPVSSKSAPSFFSSLTEAVADGFRCTVLVCAYILFFSVLRRMPEQLLPLSDSNPLYGAVLSGILEISGGIHALQAVLSPALRLVIASFILGFGGISVLFQTLGLLADTDIPRSFLLPARLTQGTISALTAILCLQFPA